MNKVTTTTLIYMPPSDSAAERAACLWTRACQAAEVSLVRVVCAVDAAVAELGDGQAGRVVPAGELVAEAGDGALAH